MYNMMFLEQKDREELQKIITSVIKGSVCHNDIDGLLSGLYLYHKFNVPIKGVFELNSKQEYSKLTCESLNLQEFIFLDLSIINKNIFSIDHHFMPFEFYDSPKNFNANRFAVFSLEFDIKFDFYYKNATSNLLWMYHLLNEDISQYSEEQLLMLILADDLFYCYNKYRSNCQEWLYNLKMQKLFELLQDKKTGEKLDRLKNKLGISFNGSQTERNGQYYSNTGFKTELVVEKICEIMNWKKPELPVVNHTIMFSNRIYDIDDYMAIKDDKFNFTCAIGSLSNGIYVSRYEGIK